MSYVGIWVQRHELTIGDVFRHMDDGGAYWVHNNPGRCFITKNGGEVGEAMGDEVDWEATRANDLTTMDTWEYLWTDSKREHALRRLRHRRQACEKVERALSSRDWAAYQRRAKKLGLPEHVSDEVFRQHYKDSAATKVAMAKTSAARDKLFDFHRDYILSRRVPIALGIYGTS